MRLFPIKKSVSVGAAAALLALLAGSAGAMSLQQAYEAALKNDPAYRMNFYENESGKENRILGRSALLPNVAASYSANKNRVDQTTHIGTREQFEQPRYISRSAVIQMRQPLFSLEAWARYREGVAMSNQSAATFEANTGEVALRVVGAYIDALFAEDQLALAKAQRESYLEQMKVNDRLFVKGEGTKTDQLETQARLDLSEAQVLESQDNVTAARNTLEGVVGMEVTSLDRLGQDFILNRSKTLSFEEWRVIALERNPDLKAARFAVEVAQQEVNKVRSGHTPRVDLVAAYSKGAAESINTYNQDTINRSIGVQVNIPLFAGGAVSASARQAVANLERAKADLQVRTNRILVELRKAHSLVESSNARLNALDKAVSSGQLLTKATEQSVKGGVRINLDLLNAQQQLVTSQRDRAQARYSYLIGTLRLRAATGTFSGDDVREVAAYFR
ncbi:MAG: type secretion protein TolC [Massilia sp.]|nr:type secretion protein TolC [Massilia sp.]